jgi:uncharacterized membrane protein
MSKGRLEAFSDGVIAIIITIMVLELKAPHGASLEELRPLLPTFFSYLLSFVFIGIYWNNHHHLLQIVKQTNGAVLWANLHLLFWLSLTPFVTAWMGENHFATLPVALYGCVLLLSGVAYFILGQVLRALHGNESLIETAIGNDLKGKISVVIYLLAIGLCFVHPWISLGLYICVAIMWLAPDRRVERVLHSED